MTKDFTKRVRSAEKGQKRLFNKKRQPQWLKPLLAAIRGGIYEHAVPLDETTYHIDTWANVLGYHLDELPSYEGFLEWLYEQVHPDDREYLEMAYQDFIEGRAATYDVEIRLRHKNGRWVWVRGVSNALEHTPDGRVKRLIGIMFDVTGRKQAEEALRQAVKKSEALNRINEILHSTLDFDEIMQRIVAEGSALLGSESAAFSLRQGDQWIVSHVHKMPASLVRAKMDDDRERHAVLALKSRQPVAVNDAFNDDRFNREHMRRHKIRSVLAAPLVVADEALGVIFFNYHTTRHEFTSEEVNFSLQMATIAGMALTNAQLYEALHESNRELNEYAYALTHNLKAPLRAIHNYVNFLFEDQADTLKGEPKTYLEGIKDAITLSNKQFEDLETLYRIKNHPLNFEPFEMIELLNELRFIFKDTSDQKLIVAQSWPVFRSERFLLRQILFDLISNGFKFNHAEIKQVEVGWQAAEGNGIEIFVRDNGIGIDPQYQQQIFDIFRRLHTESEYEGTGIGLAIVKRAVQKIGGTLRVESAVGGGSTYYINLPNSMLENNHL